MQSRPNKMAMDEAGVCQAGSDQLAFGQRIINYIRWALLLVLLLFNNLGFTEDRSSVWPINLALVAGLFLTGFIQFRLNQAWRGFGRGTVLALAIVQDALLTLGVALTGFYDSHFFIFYYPSLLGFALTFSLPASLLYTTAIGLVYAALCWFMPPGLNGDPLAIKVLVERWLVVYMIVLIGWFIVRQERERRLQAVSDERRMARENEELYLNLSAQMENWRLISEGNQQAGKHLAALAWDLNRLAGEMGEGAEEIVAATSEMGGRAASFVDQVAAIGQMTDQVVLAAHDLAASAGPTGTSSARAQRAVAQATQVAQSLSERAEMIADLSESVRQVADQTNLLAFNANIEAIQAGAEGQRFAVVANEVRQVADQAILLAREIGSMSDEVQTGTRQMLNAMAEIADMVEQTVALVQITSETGESQKTSSDMMARSVGALQVLSQKNAADVRAVEGTVQRQQVTLQRVLVLGQELAEEAGSLRWLADLLEEDEA